MQTSTTTKKILFLVSSAPRYEGDSTAPFILNMAQDLCDLGWQVDILAPHAKGLLKKEKIGKVTVYRFQYLWPESLQTLCYNGGVAANLRLSRLNYFKIPFFVLSEFVSVLAYVLKQKPALIHSHWIIPQGYIGEIISSLFGIPHVVSVHGADIYGFQHKIFRFFKYRTIKGSNFVIANSTATKKKTDDLFPQPNIAIIPTGTMPFSPREKSLDKRRKICDDQTKLIVFLGRIVEEKGLKYLIEALPNIREKDNAKLLVIGDGVDRKNMEALSKTLGLEEYIIFMGAVPHAQIYEYLSLADVFVGPSITMKSGWVEAQGNTFVEAMFARIPVVASHIGGIPDAVIHGKTGLLVSEKSSCEIADAVHKIFSDPVLVSKLAEAAYEHVHRNFSRYKTADKISAIYQELLANES